MVLTGIFFSFLIFAPGKVYATCYTPSEAAAEQGLRLHNELMVIALNCRHIQYGKDKVPYQKYQSFTNRQEEVLKDYESRMINFFKKQGHINPLKKFNSLRTDIANDLAGLVVEMRPDVFCYKYLKRLDQANSMSMQEFRQWSATYFPNSPPSKDFCPETFIEPAAGFDKG